MPLARKGQKRAMKREETTLRPLRKAIFGSNPVPETAPVPTNDERVYAERVASMPLVYRVTAPGEARALYEALIARHGLRWADSELVVADGEA